MANIVTGTPAQIDGWLQHADFRLHAGQYTYSLPTLTSTWPGYAAGSEAYLPWYLPNAALATAFRSAMTIWDSYIAPTFVEVADNATSRGEVRVAFTTKPTDFFGYADSGNTSVAGSRVGDIWIANEHNNDSYAPGSYAFEAVLHEIGHTLGLKHSFESPAVPSGYESTRYTIMSYTQPTENVFTLTVSGNTLNYNGHPVETITPMVLDIAAAQAIYGTDPTTRAGNTVYTFSQDDAVLQTIYDAGGNDTIDLSHFARPSTVDLTPGSYSTIGYWSAADQAGYWRSIYPSVANLIDTLFATKSPFTWTDNLAIALSTTIENAKGGSAADLLSGNDVANVLIGNGGNDTMLGGAGDDTLIGGSGADVLTGGAGSDVFLGTRFELNGDRITDFALGDRITITDASYVGFTYAWAGSSLTFGATAIDLATFTGRLILAANGDGVDLIAGRTGSLRDINGDDRSDILWRHMGGSLATWQVGVNGTQAQGAYIGYVDPTWKIVETMDFNGDGNADILWRHAGGMMSIWTGGANGQLQAGSYANASVGNDWRIAGVGDINGDGRDDILWQHNSGAISTWNSNGTGFEFNSYYHASPGAGWKVEGLADLNGDGRADLVWRNDNGDLATWVADGSGFVEGGYSNGGVPSSWHIVGLADFDGDGRADILWRSDNGALSLWHSNGAGFDQGAYNISVPTSWKVATVGDFNADGRSDILWRNDNGALSTWQSNGSGFDQGVYNVWVDPSWSIVGHIFPI